MRRARTTTGGRRRGAAAARGAAALLVLLHLGLPGVAPAQDAPEEPRFLARIDLPRGRASADALDAWMEGEGIAAAGAGAARAAWERHVAPVGGALLDAEAPAVVLLLDPTQVIDPLLLHLRSDDPAALEADLAARGLVVERAGDRVAVAGAARTMLSAGASPMARRTAEADARVLVVVRLDVAAFAARHRGELGEALAGWLRASGAAAPALRRLATLAGVERDHAARGVAAALLEVATQCEVVTFRLERDGSAWRATLALEPRAGTLLARTAEWQPEGPLSGPDGVELPWDAAAEAPAWGVAADLPWGWLAAQAPVAPQTRGPRPVAPLVASLAAATLRALDGPLVVLGASASADESAPPETRAFAAMTPAARDAWARDLDLALAPLAAGDPGDPGEASPVWVPAGAAPAGDEASAGFRLLGALAPGAGAPDDLLASLFLLDVPSRPGVRVVVGGAEVPFVPPPRPAPRLAFPPEALAPGDPTELRAVVFGDRAALARLAPWEAPRRSGGAAWCVSLAAPAGGWLVHVAPMPPLPLEHP